MYAQAYFEEEDISNGSFNCTNYVESFKSFGRAIRSPPLPRSANGDGWRWGHDPSAPVSIGHAKMLIQQGANLDQVETQIENLKKKGIRGADQAIEFLDDVLDQLGVR